MKTLIGHSRGRLISEEHAEIVSYAILLCDDTIPTPTYFSDMPTIIRRYCRSMQIPMHYLDEVEKLNLWTDKHFNPHLQQYFVGPIRNYLNTVISKMFTRKIRPASRDNKINKRKAFLKSLV